MQHLLNPLSKYLSRPEKFSKIRLHKKIADNINKSRRPLAELKAELSSQLICRPSCSKVRETLTTSSRERQFSVLDPIASKLGKKEGLSQRPAIRG